MKPRLIDVAAIHGLELARHGHREVIDIHVEVMSGTPYLVRFSGDDFANIVRNLSKALKTSKGVSGS